MEGGRPALAHVEELILCTLSEVHDGLFCDAVLEICIDSTEGETLHLYTAAVLEGVVCKLFIVAVVVEYAVILLLGKELKSLFCYNGHL